MITPAQLKAKGGVYISPQLELVFVEAIIEIQRKMEFIFARDGMDGLSQMDAMLDERVVEFNAHNPEVHEFYSDPTGIRPDFEWWVTGKMNKAGWDISLRVVQPGELDASIRLRMAGKVRIAFSIKPKEMEAA